MTANYEHYRRAQRDFYNEHIANVTAYEVINSMSTPGHASFARHQYIPPSLLTKSRRGIFAYHGVGVGKTRFAIRAAESLYARGLIDRVVILTKERIIPDWTRELFDGSTCESTLIGVTHHARLAKKHFTFKNSHIHIMGYISYGNILSTPQEQALLDRTCIIIDEGHKVTGDTDIHRSIRAALSVWSTYIVMLTATPSFNDPYAIADILNILLLNDKHTELPVKDAFMASLFGDTFANYTGMSVNDILRCSVDIIRATKSVSNDAAAFLSACNHYVSYVHECNSIIKVVNVSYDSAFSAGLTSGSTEPSTLTVEGSPSASMIAVEGSPSASIVALDMAPDSYQSVAYNTLVSDIGPHALMSVSSSTHVKCICVFTFPDLTYGMVGSSKHIMITRTPRGVTIKLNPGSESLMESFKTPSKLACMSVKFDYILKRINYIMNGNVESLPDRYFPYISNKLTKKTFIYAEQIRGIIDVLAVVLIANGFSLYPNVSGKMGCFAIVCADASICKADEATEIQNIFNSDNCCIDILIGTGILREGVMLKNVSEVFKMYSWWNLNDGKQVDGRFNRPNCRTNNNPDDTIYIHQLILRNTADHVIDTFSHIKDHICKAIQDMVFNASMDYYLNYTYNQKERGSSETDSECVFDLTLNNVSLPKCEERILYDMITTVVSQNSHSIHDLVLSILTTINSRKYTPDLLINRYTEFDIQTVAPLFQTIIIDILQRNTGLLLFDRLYRRSSIIVSDGTVYMKPITKSILTEVSSNHETFYMPNYNQQDCAFDYNSGNTVITPRPRKKQRTIIPPTRTLPEDAIISGLKRLNGGYMAFCETNAGTGSTVFKLVTPTHQKRIRKHVSAINRNTVNTGRNIAFYRIAEILQFHREITGDDTDCRNKSDIIQNIKRTYDAVTDVIDI